MQIPLIAFQTTVPILALACNTFCHILIIRLFPRFGMLKSLIAGFVSGIFFLVCFELILLFLDINRTENLALIISNTIIYASLGYCYFHFVNLGETGRRIRIIRELFDSEKPLTFEEIQKRYNARMIVDIRLQRLLNTGQIHEKNNRYFIGKLTLLSISKLIILMKLMIIGKRSELDS